MKMSSGQINRMVRNVFDQLKAKNLVTFKEAENKVFERACQLIDDQYQKERDIEQEAKRICDELDRKNPNSFEFSKMLNMVKKKLASERKIIL